MEYFFEISKIIDSGLSCNAPVLKAYSEQLSQKLIKNGDSEAGKAILDRLNAVTQNVSAMRSSNVEHSITTNILKRPIPVEKDSRFSLADKANFERGEVNLFLSDEQSNKVERFVKNVQMREKLMALNLPINPSLLLHGVPGTGKSKMAAYIASHLGLPLVTARSDALISSYLGSTSKNIRSLLEYAQSEPCVLFLDEFDAIAKARDDKNEIGELKRVVVSLLQNIDNLGETVLIAATNHPHLLDPAIWRRFHYKMELGKPDDKAREAMIRSLLTLFKRSEKDLKQLVVFSDGLTGAEIEIASNSYLRHIVIDELPFDLFGLVREFLNHKFEWFSIEDDKRNESIIKLRLENEALFSHRTLGKIYGMSASNVGKILRG